MKEPYIPGGSSGMDEKKTTLDSTDWKILGELQKDARLPSLRKRTFTGSWTT